jgi:hypothetical protein
MKNKLIKNSFSDIRRINFKTDSIEIANIIIDNFRPTLLFYNSFFYRFYNFIKIGKPLLILFDKTHHLISKYCDTFIWVDNKGIVFCMTVKRVNLFNNKNWLLCNAAFNKSYPLKDLKILSKIRTILKIVIDHIKINCGKYLFADIQINNKVPFLFCKNIGFKFNKLIIYHFCGSNDWNQRSLFLNKMIYFKKLFHSINYSIMQLNNFRYKSLQIELENKKSSFFIKNDLSKFNIYYLEKRIGMIKLNTSKIELKVIINLDLEDKNLDLIKEEEFFIKVFQLFNNSCRSIIFNINIENESILKCLNKLDPINNLIYRRLILSLN